MKITNVRFRNAKEIIDRFGNSVTIAVEFKIKDGSVYVGMPEKFTALDGHITIAFKWVQRVRYSYINFGDQGSKNIPEKAIVGDEYIAIGNIQKWKNPIEVSFPLVDFWFLKSQKNMLMTLWTTGREKYTLSSFEKDTTRIQSLQTHQENNTS